MRGNPLLRAAVMVVLLLLIAGPLWHVTMWAEPAAMDKVETKAAAPAGSGVVETVKVEANFAPAAEQFTLKYLGKALVQVDHPGAQWEGAITLAPPDAEAELVVEASWGERTEASAVRLRLQAAGRSATEETFWSSGPLMQVAKLR